MNTYTATVTDSTDWAEYTVEVTDDSDQGTEGSLSWRTRAYDDAEGQFNADLFDAETLTREIVEALSTFGWRPVAEVSFDEDRNTFAVEQF
jgi:hypothetical protein